MPPILQERRKSPRTNLLDRIGVRLLRPRGSVPVTSVNVSARGLCFRLEEELVVRSLVRLQVIPDEGRSRTVECSGRVAWVIQRSDLRSAPPFLFDIGVEFVNPPQTLRQWMTGRLGAETAQAPSATSKALEPIAIRNRTFLPRLKRDANGSSRWHLVVSSDGTPCFSGRYGSEHEALAAWAKFKRERAKR